MFFIGRGEVSPRASMAIETQNFASLRPYAAPLSARHRYDTISFGQMARVEITAAKRFPDRYRKTDDIHRDIVLQCGIGQR